MKQFSRKELILWMLLNFLDVIMKAYWYWSHSLTRQLAQARTAHLTQTTGGIIWRPRRLVIIFGKKKLNVLLNWASINLGWLILDEV